MMKPSNTSLIVPIFRFLLLSGCQSIDGLGLKTTKDPDELDVVKIAAQDIGDKDDLGRRKGPASFSEFKRKTRKGDFEANIDAERYSLLKEAAVTYSAQAGYQRRVWQIMRQLEQDSLKLSKSFDFNRVAYRAPRETGYILPPVVSRATAAINVDESGKSAVAADEYYRMEIPGRIVSVIPTWRDYLIIPLETATEPEDTFLPQNKEEKRAFDKFAAQGWSAGVDQADEALDLNFARLKRDYLGMVEYRKMVKAGLVKDMVIRSSEKRSTGEGDELFIGERRVKIVNAAKLVRNPNKWKPLRRRFAVNK